MINYNTMDYSKVPYYCLARTKHTNTFSGFEAGIDAIYPPDTLVKVIGYVAGDPICLFPNSQYLRLHGLYEVTLGV